MSTATDKAETPIEKAYAAYDSDKRVHGPDDFEAFRDAVAPLLVKPLVVPRDITYIPGKTNIAESFGVSVDRIAEIDADVMELARADVHPGQVIQQLAARSDITDAEYTAIVFVMG